MSALNDVILKINPSEHVRLRQAEMKKTSENFRQFLIDGEYFVHEKRKTQIRRTQNGLFTYKWMYAQRIQELNGCDLLMVEYAEWCIQTVSDWTKKPTGSNQFRI